MARSPTNPSPPFHQPNPPTNTSILLLRFQPAHSYYTDGSFTLPDGEGKDNIVGAGVFNRSLQVNIIAHLPEYPNILIVEIYALLITAVYTIMLSMNTFILKK